MHFLLQIEVDPTQPDNEYPEPYYRGCKSFIEAFEKNHIQPITDIYLEIDGWVATGKLLAIAGQNEDVTILKPGDYGKVSAEDIAMVARATGGRIRSPEIIP